MSEKLLNQFPASHPPPPPPPKNKNKIKNKKQKKTKKNPKKQVFVCRHNLLTVNSEILARVLIS